MQALIQSLDSLSPATMLLCLGVIFLFVMVLFLWRDKTRQAMLEERLRALSQETREVVAGAVSQENSMLRSEFHQALNNLSSTQVSRFVEFSQLIASANTAMAEQSATLRREVAENLRASNDQNAKLRQDLTVNVTELTQSLKKDFGEVRATMQQQMTAMQSGNEQKLEQMRATVEEKLQTTLETRLTESFKQVANQLKLVEEGLGEMRNLAGQVGELKRVLTNVKTRGTFGEMQLANILEDIMTPDQYEANVATVPGSPERVEFAIKMPGQGAGEYIWLPIDAKFPLEDWQRLEDARDVNDRGAIDSAVKALESRVKLEAKKIREKYISTPYTTEFAVLFLPSEALYAECLRIPGLVQKVQSDYHVTITGPTVLSALLNSLQMGFRTLALQKRSAEVWMVLGKVKMEFQKFVDTMAKIEKQVDTVKNTIGDIRTRTNQMGRSLKSVEILPGETKAVSIAEVLTKKDE